MKKSLYVLVGVVLFTLVGVLFIERNKVEHIKNNVTSNSEISAEVSNEIVATTTLISSTTSTVDSTLNSLLRVREGFYKGDSGAYENLNDAEREILDNTLPHPTEQQKNGEGLPYWDKWLTKNQITDIDKARDDWVKHSGIFALKGDYVVIYSPIKSNKIGVDTKTTGRHLQIYTIKDRIDFSQYRRDQTICGPEDGIYGDDVFVCNSQIGLIQNRQMLLYYKPGMKNFRRISSSILSDQSQSETYYNQLYTDKFSPQLEGKIEGNTLTISVFRWRDGSNKQREMFTKVRDVTLQIEDTPSTMTPVPFQKKTSWSEIKTCRNEKYGYEFQYPRDWYLYTDKVTATPGSGFVYKEEAQDCNADVIVVTAQTRHERPQSDYLPSQIRFTISTTTRGMTIDEIHEDYREKLDVYDKGGSSYSFLCPTMKETAVYLIDGQKASYIQWLCPDYKKANTLNVNSEVLEFVNKEKTWKMTVDGALWPADIRNEIKETILSTFKFTK